MAELHELERVARCVSIIRPGWHPKSILTWLTTTDAGRSVACRPFQDVAVAFVACALDERSDTPARVAEPGPWWQVADRAARPAPATFTPGPGDDPACRRPGHEHERAASCRWCRAEHLAATEGEQPARPIPAPADWRAR